MTAPIPTGTFPTGTFPTGTFTFFFTDIEGSTQLWELHPEAMKFALSRHDAILRTAIESHGGHVFKTLGDEFCAVFSAAPDALAAALDAQRNLLNEPWGNTPIKVRIALHTGAAENRDGDYFGPPLNRVARLLAAGHGGQTLVSAATDELVRDHLLVGTQLRDMGEWQLKDITSPEHIYQLVAPGLPSEFSPLRTMDALRTNLPAQLTSFVGRKKEMAAIKQLIANNRLTTLVGPGGTGKTRLSLEIGADLVNVFADGVWFIELASLTDPSLLPQAAATAVGLREEPGRSLLESLSGYLRPKTALLILDNCEHMVEASAHFAETLLRNCPVLRILTSSREALSIPGEASYRVPPLSVPDAYALEKLNSPMQYEAVRLFVERATTVLPSFTLTEKDAPIVAQICSRLDGIPLAIELAAVRVKILKVEQIAERLNDRFRLLTGGSRTALPRQQTLRALIDWSYDLLSEPERAMLMQLSVFVSGWTLEAAEAVVSIQLSVTSEQPLKTEHWSLTTDVLDLLMQLVNKSLVTMDIDDETEPRYRLLETVRQYAREKLLENDQAVEQTRDRHLAYFLNVAQQAEADLTGPRVAECLYQLEIELDNLRAALEWALNRNIHAGLQLVSDLFWFWDESGRLRDGLYWLEQFLAKPEGREPTLLRARALSIQGTLAGSRTSLQESQAIYRTIDDKLGLAFSLLYLGRLIFQEDNQQAKQLITESLSLYRALGNKPGMSEALNHLGVLASDMKDYEQAHLYLEEGLTICREIKYVACMTRTLADLGLLAIKEENYPLARRWLEESISNQNNIGKGGAIIYSLLLLGELSLREGNFAEARGYYERSLAVAKKAGISPWAPLKWIPVHLGYIALKQGNLAQAEKHFIESHQSFKNTGITIGIVYTIEGQAALALQQGAPQQAAQLFAWANAMRENIGNSRPPIEQTSVERDLATIRTQLDAATFTAAQAAGRAMSIDEVVSYAIQGG